MHVLDRTASWTRREAHPVLRVSVCSDFIVQRHSNETIFGGDRSAWADSVVGYVIAL